jgi:hypothetical protein
MNKYSAQNAGNGISGRQISNIFWGKLTIVIVMHPSLTNQARSTPAYPSGLQLANHTFLYHCDKRSQHMH